MSNEFNYVGLTENPQRNGIFIAELVAYLLPSSASAQNLRDRSYIN